MQHGRPTVLYLYPTVILYSVPLTPLGQSLRPANRVEYGVHIPKVSRRRPVLTVQQPISQSQPNEESAPLAPAAAVVEVVQYSTVLYGLVDRMDGWLGARQSLDLGPMSSHL